MKRLKEAGLVLIIGLIAVAIASCVGAWLVALIWNAVMPHMFGLPEISWWMAWLLLVLLSILFKN